MIDQFTVVDGKVLIMADIASALVVGLSCAGLFGLAIVLWPFTIHVISTLLVPIFRKHLGESLSNGMFVFIELLDGILVPTRRALSSGLDALKDRQNIPGTEEWSVKEEVLTRDQLPNDVRRGFDRRRATSQHSNPTLFGRIASYLRRRAMLLIHKLFGRSIKGESRG